MSAARWAVPALLAVASVAAGPAAAPPDVLFLSPPAGRPALGAVRIEVEVLSDAVREVIFAVDGVERGRKRRPPFRLDLDLGGAVGPHRFEVEVHGPGGVVARAVRETPGLRVDEAIELRLMQLYVSVDGAAGGLEAADFRVLDDGQGQEIVTFEGGEAALTVALLVDASESMRGARLEAALAGARSFLGGMEELDEASLYLFSDALLYRAPFSEDPLQLETALARVAAAAGGTALNDVLYQAVRQLEARQGRRVVVLLSDGLDIHSALGVDDVLWAVRRSRAAVYWIEPSADPERRIVSHWRTAEQHDHERQGLRRTVRESGGRVLPIATIDGVAGAFAEILAELRSQVVLGYYPRRDLDDGRWHEVRVRVRRPGVKVRTRGGYVDW